MPNTQLADKEFLDKLEQIVGENLSNEHFGVSELAREIGISRSSLHRKVKSFTKTSAILFISHKRLEHALDMLQHTSFTVSEVAYKVGFNSPSYFIKCFRDYYGYTPGEVGAREEDENDLVSEKSIIVLPFENISPEPDQEYFCDGLTEEITTHLSHITELLVISRSSAMTFKGTRSTIKEITEKVNVSFVLQGSVRKSGNNIRITVQLIDAGSDTHIWAENYNEVLENIFDIQENVSRSIIETLKIKLSTKEDKQIARRPIDNVLAYEIHLRAKYQLYLFSADSINKAIELAKKGIDLFGENENLLADLGKGFLATYEFISKENRSNLAAAKEYINKIFNLNPESSVGHSLKGELYLRQGKIQKAILEFKKTLESDPNDITSLMRLGWTSTLLGNTQTGKIYLMRAIEMDPLTPLSHMMLGVYEFMEAKFKEGQEHIIKALELEPKNTIFQFWNAMGYAWDNNIKEAVKIFKLVEKDSDPFIFGKLSTLFSFTLQGRTEQAFLAITDDLLSLAKEDEMYPIWMAECFSILGRNSEAIYWLKQGIDYGFTHYPWLSERDPFLENIRSDDGFIKLIKKVKNKWEAIQFELN